MIDYSKYLEEGNLLEIYKDGELISNSPFSVKDNGLYDCNGKESKNLMMNILTTDDYTVEEYNDYGNYRPEKGSVYYVVSDNLSILKLYYPRDHVYVRPRNGKVFKSKRSAERYYEFLKFVNENAIDIIKYVNKFKLIESEDYESVKPIHLVYIVYNYIDMTINMLGVTSQYILYGTIYFEYSKAKELLKIFTDKELKAFMFNIYK